MGTEFKKMFDRLKKINEELEVKKIALTEVNSNLPNKDEYECEYHEYLKRLEVEGFDECDLHSEYPFK